VKYCVCVSCPVSEGLLVEPVILMEHSRDIDSDMTLAEEQVHFTLDWVPPPGPRISEYCIR